MSLEKAKAYLKDRGFEDRVMVFEVSSATVALAAEAIGTQPERIAKSLTFWVGGQPALIVCAGDAKVNNGKFKAQFGEKARMLSAEEVHERIGHDVGGVCPFGVEPDVQVYLDESLKRFDVVYPACGSSNSAVRLILPELEQLAAPKGWVDVTVLPESV